MRGSRRGIWVGNEVPSACACLHLGINSVKPSVVRLGFTGGVNVKAEETTDHRVP